MSSPSTCIYVNISILYTICTYMYMFIYICICIYMYTCVYVCICVAPVLSLATRPELARLFRSAYFTLSHNKSHISQQATAYFPSSHLGALPGMIFHVKSSGWRKVNSARATRPDLARLLRSANPLMRSKSS